MNTAMVMQIGKETLLMALWVVGPIFAIGFVVGLAISLIQAVMQLQEMTLAVVPKMFAIGASLIIFGHWMLEHLISYFQRFLGNFSVFLGQ